MVGNYCFSEIIGPASLVFDKMKYVRGKIGEYFHAPTKLFKNISYPTKRGQKFSYPYTPYSTPTYWIKNGQPLRKKSYFLTSHCEEQQNFY